MKAVLFDFANLVKPFIPARPAYCLERQEMLRFQTIAIRFGFSMFNECKHLHDILDAQVDIIERHIDQHKWFHGIANKDKAISDFIEKYGFIMREFYCSRVCKDRFDCEVAQRYNPK
jgi:hypothetical protein